MIAEPAALPLLSLRDLSVRFAVPGGPVEAVKGVSFDVQPGATVALVGESGSGKSVLAQAILGILPKSARIASGEIWLNRDGQRQNLAALDPESPVFRAIRGRDIAIVFQEPMTALSPLHTIGNQIFEALHLHRRVDDATGRDLVMDMLRRVGFKDPAAALGAYTFELSGGLRQRAMIAMALICRPALLIADEPTTALDVTLQAQILKLTADLQAELGMAVLMITHDLGVVANTARDTIVMYHGKIMESGPTAELFGSPRHPYLRALLAATPKPGHDRSQPLQPIRDYPRLRPSVTPKPADSGAPLLTIEHVSKRFAARGGLFGFKKTAPHTAVDDVSLTLKRGECLALVGESGCGKTTLSRLILGAIKPDAGKILFHDHARPLDVHALTPEDRMIFRRKAQFIFQDPFGSLNPRMTVADLIGEPLAIHGIGTAAEQRARVDELLAQVGLNPSHRNRYPHSFSGGQRQRIGIARALALNPDFIICDEPVSALDVSIQAQILNLLKELKNELGLTYLFISHNLAVVDYLADRVAVMCAGRIVEFAERAQLFAAPQHPYTQALLAAVPVPDLAHPLDFGKLMEGRASNPAAWPDPFTIDGNRSPGLVEIAPGHLVRAAA
ncbi:ABC transporter ATP-binding protein [Elstera cyanobacteriorum]|uniref:ABC transporter ATP-binding protein n=1 Tax=Elstera cyanobacteriorum TaxID=2022747 RepID=UPI0023537485|nr:ABC transporter ATP-binding protein [Elstera cyanobacteriorum]MCK6442727.1 ABC transporter ATP-binding protein [Elstera cyanobacteriorum]